MTKARGTTPGRPQWLKAAALCLPLAAALGATDRDPSADPHRDPNACTVCHDAAGGKPSTIPPAAADGICIGCHDGKHASRESHPVGRALQAPKINPQWPLRDGRLSCLTCHDMKPGCIGDLQDQTNAMFLRGDAGDNKAQTPFCGNCHRETAYRKANPHQMLRGEGPSAQVIEPKCLFCHEKPMDRSTLTRGRSPSLKTNVGLLCHDCHPHHRDSIPDKHVGAKVTPEMQARSAIRESIGLDSPLPAPLLAEALQQKRRTPLLPLDQNDRMICTTCHNPHPAGLFPRNSELAYRGLVMRQDGRLASPVRNAAWCRYCHEL